MYSMLRNVLLMITVALFSSSLYAGEKPSYLVNGVAVSGYDTVAYFTQGAAVLGNKSFSLTHNGSLWRFSSEANKQLFIADPAKYSPQYGGHCAFAMANDKRVSADPKAFTIVDDKLYLNYSLAVRVRWSKDIPGYNMDAIEYWNKL
ncbi:MAG: tat pathway signal sequence domain protein [Oceanospirillaceae bacterium]|nr:tat pathway signal sequence domain protein [Oceanospirillaceae bacterium]